MLVAISLAMVGKHRILKSSCLKIKIKGWYKCAMTKLRCEKSTMVLS